MSKLSIRAIACIVWGLISCSIEDSSSAVRSSSKKIQKNGNLIIDKAMSDREGYERLGEVTDTFGVDSQAQPILKKPLNGSLMK